MAKRRTLADWLWLAVGIAGLACIGIAIYLFVEGEPSPEEAARRRVEQAEEAWAEGRKLLAAGDHEGAVEKLSAAVSVPEMLTEARLQHDLGVALMGAGREQEAVAAWTNSRKLAPTDCEPYLDLGKYFERKGQYEEALHQLRAGAAFHPAPVPPRQLTRKVAELEKRVEAQFARTRDELVKRFVGNPADTGALAGLVLLRLRTIDCPVDAAPADGIRYSVLAAGEDVGNLEELLARQQSAVGDRPGSAVDRSGLGSVHLLRGEFERAGVVFAEAMRISGVDRTSVLGGAIADLITGSEDEARMETAVQLLRGSPLPWIVLGAGLIAHGKGEPARQALRQGLRLNPALPETCRLLGASFNSPDDEKQREMYLRAYRRLKE